VGAHDHLNPQEFFHASPTELEVGGSLLPPSRTGNRIYQISEDDKVYLSSNRTEAMEWGRGAAEMTGASRLFLYGASAPGASHLPDDDDPDQWVAPQATITSREEFPYVWD